MPRVGQQQFPCTQKGMRDAEQYSRLTGIPVQHEQGQQPGLGRPGPQGGYGGGMNRPPQIGAPSPMAMRNRGIGPGLGGMPQQRNPIQGLRNVVNPRQNQFAGGGYGGGMPRRPMPGRMPGGMPRRPMRGGMPGGGGYGGGNPLAALAGRGMPGQGGGLGNIGGMVGKMAFDQNRRNYGRLTDGKDIV